MKKIGILIILIVVLFANISAEAKKSVDDTYRMEYLNLEWWDNYKDPILSEYLLKLYRDNQDLKIATLKSNQSAQIVKMSFAQELPQLGFNGNIGREFTSSNVQFGELIIPDYKQTRFLLPLTMTYEVDIWGKNRQITKSFVKQLDNVKQDERASYISITSAFASDYFNLIKADALLKNQEALVNIQKNIVDYTQKKYEAGLLPITAVLEEKQLLSSFEEQFNHLEEKQELLTNQLFVYVGDRTNQEIKRISYQDLNLIGIPESIDTVAIQYRPDLIKTENYIEKTGLDVKVARKEFLPDFTIYGQVGFNAYQLSKMFMPHTFLSSAGVMPNLDLFTGGMKTAKLKYRKLEYQKAIQYYEKTVLTSVQELNDALMSAKTTDKNRKIAEERYNLENEKYNLADKKMQIGASEKIEFLKAEERLLLSENMEISAKINYLIATINLYKAVGGKDYNKLDESTL